MGSPERLYIPMVNGWAYNENEMKHIARYRLASTMAHGSILDIACGSGYGSKILSERGNVVGVDPSSEAIDYANKVNKADNITFIQESAQTYVPDQSFDTIVCLETFEHMPPIQGFDMVMDFIDWLRPGGQIVLSTPMLRYKNGEPFITNPYHINEMPRDRFIKMVNDLFGGFKINYFHQNGPYFRVLDDENTAFLIMIARKV